MSFNIELPDIDAVNTLLGALAKTPWEVADPYIQSIRQQVLLQIEAQKEASNAQKIEPDQPQPNGDDVDPKNPPE